MGDVAIAVPVLVVVPDGSGDASFEAQRLDNANPRLFSRLPGLACSPLGFSLGVHGSRTEQFVCQMQVARLEVVQATEFNRYFCFSTGRIPGYEQALAVHFRTGLPRMDAKLFIGP
jgi:hypothetical protein